MREVSADKGYTARDTHDAIAAVGATPFILFKHNATGGIGGLYAKLFHFFNYKREEFLAHYHQRSNVESTIVGNQDENSEAPCGPRPSQWPAMKCWRKSDRADVLIGTRPGPQPPTAGFLCAGGKMVRVSQPPLEYETPRQARSIRTKPLAYWAAFGAGVFPGLFLASMTADLVSFTRTGHHSDGGATIISAAGIPFAVIVAGVVREMRRLTSWRFSLCCGLLAAPVALGALFLYSAL